jgi:hypothetical protein
MDFSEVGITLMDVAWLHYPSDHYSAVCSVDSFEEAEQIARRATQMGLMSHIETRVFEDCPYFVVEFATPKWVDNYYSSGGVWRFHWHHPEVKGWFTDLGAD